MNEWSFKFAVATCGIGLSTLFGGWDTLIYTLFILIVVDYISGVMAAAKTRSLSSSIGFDGILKKLMMLMIVVLGVCLDNTFSYTEPYIRTGVIYFFIANEGISILENGQALGLPIPDFLSNLLEAVSNQEGPKHGK